MRSFGVRTRCVIKRILQQANNLCALVVINAAPVQGSRHEDTAELVREEGFEVVPVVLYHRSIYGDSMNVGKTPTEFDARSKATLELKGIYDYFYKKI